MKYLGAITDDYDLVNKKYVDEHGGTLPSSASFDELTVNSLLVNGNARIVNGTLIGGLYATTTATLSSSGWSSNSQTVTVNGVTTSSLVLASPAPASAAVWSGAGIVCSGQAANSLTFTCEATPSASVTVNIIIM